MKKLSEQFPKFFAFLALVGITSGVEENATHVQLSADALKIFESKIQTEITDVAAENAQMKTDLKKAQDDLKAEQAQLTALATAIDAGCKAAGVDAQKNLVDGVTKMTETLTKWGALPGALTTTVASEKDKGEDGGVKLIGSADYGMKQFELKN